MSKGTGSLLLLLHLCLLRSSLALECHCEISNEPHPEPDCFQFQKRTCNDNEICFTHHFVTFTGRLRVESGCLPLTSSFLCEEPFTDTLAVQCCDTDNCNVAFHDVDNFPTLPPDATFTNTTTDDTTTEDTTSDDATTFTTTDDTTTGNTTSDNAHSTTQVPTPATSTVSFTESRPPSPSSPPSPPEGSRPPSLSPSTSDNAILLGGGEVPQQPFVAWWIIAVSVSATVIMVVLVVAVTVGIIVALKWSRTGLESEVSSETGLKSPTLKLKGQQQQVFVTVSVDNKVTCAHA